jgi:CubicO group peptidase (beta-lactamase class C family)
MPIKDYSKRDIMNQYQEKFNSVAEQVEQWRREAGVPGIALGISTEEGIFTKGLGITSYDNPLTVTDDTLFQIGSISKTVTATAMMCLVDAGQIDLDERVQTYLPDFHVQDEAVSKSVTVKHLITHVSGWVGDVFTDTGSNDSSLAEYVAQMAELTQLADMDYALSYNNAAFAVAGRIIEVITGKTFEAAIQELIFNPLGLEHCFYFPRDVMLHRFVVGHRVGDSGTKVLSPWPIPRASNPAGGISAHIKDLLAYGRYHLGDGAPLLKPETLQFMQTPQVAVNSYIGAVGLSWFTRDFGGIKGVTHNGSTIGQNSILMLLPEKNFAYALVTNAENGGAIHAKFHRLVLKEFFDVIDPEPEEIDSTLEQLAEYVGTYTRPLMEINLEIVDEQLTASVKFNSDSGLPNDEPADSPPPAPMARCGVDQLFVTDGLMKNLRADFLRDIENQITHLRFGSRINPRL